MIDEGGLVADERVSIDAVTGALSGRFAVGPVRSESLEWVYYDTFDALVRAAGRTLAWEGDAPPDPAELDDDTKAVVGVRALLPQARVHAETEVVPLLDELEKTVARVRIASLTVILQDGERRPLPPRVSVAGVRGYDEELRVAGELLQSALRLRPPRCTLHDEAVNAAGADPAGVSSKLDVVLDPAERADRAASRVLTALLEVADANLPGTLSDTDTEFLHDYRVSIRRTRAVLREFRGVFPPRDWEHFRRELRWLQGVTSDTRDLDVYVLGFEELRGLVPTVLREDLEPLREVLERRREAARGAMVSELRGERARVLRNDWAAFLEGLENRSLKERPDAPRPIEVVSAWRIRRLHRRMLRMGGAIWGAGDAPAEAYHELRKQGKELRYLLELFGLPLHDPGVVRPMIRALKGLQDVLGRHQDREVQLQTVRDLAADVAVLPGGPEALMGMGVLVDRLEQDAARARGEFASSFAEFASPQQRMLVKETFR